MRANIPERSVIRELTSLSRESFWSVDAFIASSNKDAGPVPCTGVEKTIQPLPAPNLGLLTLPVLA